MSLVFSLLLLIGVLSYVFFPRRSIVVQRSKTRAEFLEERRDVLYENLRDLNFEYRAGKYPEEDYAAQRSALEHEATDVVTEIRVMERTRGV